MTIKNVQSGSAGRIEDLRNQSESNRSIGVTDNRGDYGQSIIQQADPGRDQRLLNQFTRSRMSLGSLQRQEQIAGMLAKRDDSQYSSERLGASMRTISAAAANTDAGRRAATENSLAKAKDVVDNGTRSERIAVGKPLNRASAAIQEKNLTTPSNGDLLNKVLDTLNQVLELMQMIIQALRQQSSQPEPQPAPA